MMEEEILMSDSDRKVVTPTETPAHHWSAYTAFQRPLDG
jgi:hypothetical protein